MRVLIKSGGYAGRTGRLRWCEPRLEGGKLVELVDLDQPVRVEDEGEFIGSTFHCERFDPVTIRSVKIEASAVEEVR
jgi:hypothetical protein